MKEKIFREVGNDKAFFTHKGPTLHSIHELANELETMSDESFSYHTTGKNDFSNWVRDVLKDTELAAEIEHASKPKMATLVKKRIRELETAETAGHTGQTDKHGSREFLLRGVVDFAVGLVVGVILGILIRSLF